MRKVLLLIISALASLATIAEEPANFISFSTNAIRVNEMSGVIKVPIQRSGDLSGVSTVQYAFHGGSAEAEVDFTTSSGVVTFQAGQGVAEIVFQLVDDPTPESLETFSIELSNPSDSHALGIASITVSIMDNDEKWSGVAGSSTFDLSMTAAMNALLVLPDHRFWYGGVPTQFGGKIGLIENDGSIAIRD